MAKKSFETGSMQTGTFQHTDDLTAALFDRLACHFKLALPPPHAVLLPGGRTPGAAYQQIAQIDGNQED